MHKNILDINGQLFTSISKPIVLIKAAKKNKRIVFKVLETTLLTLPLVLNLLNKALSAKENKILFKVAKNPIAIESMLIEADNKSLIDVKEIKSGLILISTKTYTATTIIAMM